MKIRTLYIRLAILTLVFMISLSFLTLELLDVQVARGAELREESERKVVRTVTVKASRGEIYDRYGRPLVVNRMSFSVRFDYMTWDKTRQNDVILRISELLSAHDKAYTDTLPISGVPFAYLYDPSAESSDRTRMEKFLKANGWEESLTPVQAMEKLREKYGIDPACTDAQARTVAGVRYDMDRRNFSSDNPFTIGSDVDMETVSVLAEYHSDYPGVVTDVDATREYATTYAAHILGRVGQIYKEEYEAYKEQGYPMNAIVGKDGMEKALESYLRGVDGKNVVETNLSGKTTGILSSEPAEAGANCYLTIDIRLQEATERALAEHIERIKTEGAARSDGVGADAQGGAAVVIDVNSGEVLAMASYPSFNLATFSVDYNTLLKDALKPMFNRAIAGEYPPGSVFKMVTATAALQEDIIEPDTEIEDKGIYTFYAPNYTPACWIYNEYGTTHGLLNVSGAIENSCNYFFFEVGRLLGITKLNDYSKRFGLGELTDIELGGESAGVLAGPAERRERDEQWYAGDTLQAAIGQSDNLFTPLQLANYVATVVNGGTRYQPHLLKTVMSNDLSSVVFEQKAVALDTIGYTQENLQAVLDGMRKVTEEDGTASKVFSDYPISVGGKTGSAQLGSGTANGVFVLAAPFEDPEIAIVVVVEHGGSGNNVAWIARDILTAYFEGKTSIEGVTAEGSLLR